MGRWEERKMGGEPDSFVVKEWEYDEPKKKKGK